MNSCAIVVPPFSGHQATATSCAAAFTVANACGSASRSRSMSPSVLYKCGAIRMLFAASSAFRLYVPVLTMIWNVSLSSVASAPLFRPTGIARRRSTGERPRNWTHNQQAQLRLEFSQSTERAFPQCSVVRLNLRHAKGMQILQSEAEAGDCVSGGCARARTLGAAPCLEERRPNAGTNTGGDEEETAARGSQCPCVCRDSVGVAP